MINTELTEMLGIKHPIIQAGMGPYSTNHLGAAAANAGALGLISTSGFRYGAMQPELVERLTGGATGTTYEMMKRLLLRIKEDTRESQGIFGINCPVAAEVAKSSSEIIQAVIDVRNEDPELKDRLKVIVTSAGGMHIAWEPVHTMVLLPAVVKAVKTPVVGAGGFCDGATLVAALALGAVGVQMGTRFIATKESEFNQFWKDHILKSGERDTIVARGIFGPGRYLKNEVSMELTKMTVRKSPGLYLGQPDDLTTLDPELMRKEMDGFNGLLREDENNAILPGGEVAGRIGELPTVQELVDGIIREAEEIILSLPKKIGGKK